MERTLTRTLMLLQLALAALLLAPMPAAAHVELVSSTPADGEQLSAPPDEVVLTFDGELDPEVSSFIVTDADGAEVGRGEVDLDVAERNVLRGDPAIEEPGTYTVAWTLAGTDGHALEGSLTFRLAGDGSAAGDGTGDEGDAPDTAVANPRSAPWPALGLLLVAASLAVAARQVLASVRGPRR